MAPDEIDTGREKLVSPLQNRHFQRCGVHHEAAGLQVGTDSFQSVPNSVQWRGEDDNIGAVAGPDEVPVGLVDGVHLLSFPGSHRLPVVAYDLELTTDRAKRLAD